MDASRFDTITRLFASRRLSRRQALAQGAGITAGVMLAPGIAPTAQAQPATPAAERKAPTMLFVQAFRSGSVTPAEASNGRFVLTLAEGLGQTVYFSDRPDRIVGANPTPQFLEAIGFPDDNPPNAALVVETPEGETEIAVLELYSPVYDDATHTATYEVAVLGEWERTAQGDFVTSDADLSDLLPEFGPAHLFIDDCPDAEIYCSRDGVNVASFGVQGHCYSPWEVTCLPCSPWWEYARDAMDQWKQMCNNTYYRECGGNCVPKGICTATNVCNAYE